MNANMLGKFGDADKAYPGAKRPASEISKNAPNCMCAAQLVA